MRGGLGDLRGRERELRHADDTVLAASESAGVGMALDGDELSLGDAASAYDSLQTVKGHGIRYGVIDLVHVLLKEHIELLADEKALGLLLVDNFIPDDLLLARCAQALILDSIEVLVFISITAAGAIVLGDHAWNVFTSLSQNGGGEEGGRDSKFHF